MNGTAEVFRRAAGIMAEKGQCKGDPYGPDGQVCLIAAISEARAEMSGTYSTPTHGYFGAVIARVFAEVETPIRNPVDWNDHPDTTQTEVEKFLLHCADVAEFDTARA